MSLWECRGRRGTRGTVGFVKLGRYDETTFQLVETLDTDEVEMVPAGEWWWIYDGLVPLRLSQSVPSSSIVWPSEMAGTIPRWPA